MAFWKWATLLIGFIIFMEFIFDIIKNPTAMGIGEALGSHLFEGFALFLGYQLASHFVKRKQKKSTPVNPYL